MNAKGRKPREPSDEDQFLDDYGQAIIGGRENEVIVPSKSKKGREKHLKHDFYEKKKKRKSK